MFRVVACSLACSILQSASPAIAQDTAVVKELSRLEDVWAAASMKKDGAAIGRMLAPGFLSMSDDGRVLDRGAAIQDANTSKDTLVSASNSGYKVQIFGPRRSSSARSRVWSRRPPAPKHAARRGPTRGSSRRTDSGCASPRSRLDS